MRVRTSLMVAITAALVSGCATTEFKPYEARENSFVGKGGTRVVVDGVDFWDNGEPPRKFKVLGIIEDERPSGLIPMGQLRTDIAKKAREAGGDGVIQLSSQSQIMGYVGTSSASAQAYGSTAYASGTSTAMPARRNHAKFAVVKYLD